MRRTSAWASAPCHHTAPPLPLSSCNKDILQFREGGNCAAPRWRYVRILGNISSATFTSHAPHLDKELERERELREKAELALRAQLEKNKRAEKALEEQTERTDRVERALKRQILIKDLKILGVGVQLPSGCAFAESSACRSRF